MRCKPCDLESFSIYIFQSNIGDLVDTFGRSSDIVWWDSGSAIATEPRTTKVHRTVEG